MDNIELTFHVKPCPENDEFTFYEKLQGNNLNEVLFQFIMTLGKMIVLEKQHIKSKEASRRLYGPNEDEIPF